MLSARKQSEDEGDGGVGYASAQKRIKIENASRDNVKKSSNKRLKDVEICVPIVYGTMAFWLGRKASEYHHLKLYSEDESGPSSTKKPVVVESYDEIVFPDPSEVFFARVQNHPAVSVPRIPATFHLPLVPIEDVHEKKRGDTKDHFLSQWFMNFSDADELLKLAAVRQQVQAYIVKLRSQLSLIKGLPQPMKPARGY
ncbi:hypothetical protein ACSBR1_009762 [Camellia fascicularis]